MSLSRLTLTLPGVRCFLTRFLLAPVAGLEAGVPGGDHLKLMEFYVMLKSKCVHYTLHEIINMTTAE